MADGGLARMLQGMGASPLLGFDQEIGEDIANGYQLGATCHADALEGGRLFRQKTKKEGQNPHNVAAMIRAAFARLAQNYGRGGGGGGGGGVEVPRGGGIFRRGGGGGRVGEEIEGDDEIGEVDEEELGAIDEEIGDIEGEEDELGGEGHQELGASYSVLKKKELKAEALLAKLEAKYNSTPSYKMKKRKHLLARMSRVRKIIAKKKAKAEHKLEKLAAKLGVPVAVLAAGGAAAAAAGISSGDIARAGNDMARGDVRAGEGFMSFWGPRAAPDQSEITLPFITALGPGLYMTKAAGVAGAAGAVTITTPAISYADFELVGVDIQAVMTMAQAADVPPLISVSNWGINGGFNQVYAEQPVTHAGGQASMSNGAGILNFSKTLPALRQDKLELGRTNTATMTLNFYAMKANAGIIDVVVTASLKLRTKKDDNLRNWGR